MACVKKTKKTSFSTGLNAKTQHVFATISQAALLETRIGELAA